MPDLDALAREVGEVPIPVLLLLDGRGHDDHVVGADPLPGASRAPLLGDEEQRDHLAPAQRGRPLAEGQHQVGVDPLFLEKKEGFDLPFQFLRCIYAGKYTK